ncbi:SPOSA6832_02912 [Sporobolomyces salmonicolor]|uniref:SPOSA6832_02912-mRNA-1:cds n=1 Tax=Sporidiobolus salmonicolor TaxID=5005 RepID=A0A0D6EMH1_SPOSA|nr:SPOSA6832_02912 [Sporobolomyces salmonicolor]
MASSRLRFSPMLDSFCGMDLKLGATLISLFAVLNKVAGAYGMLAVLTGGGAALSQPIGQLTMYLYSIASLVGFIWGLQRIAEENGPKTLIYAHLFAIDHLVGTLWTSLFAVIWYVYVPHDGRRVANSDAQKAMMGANTGTGLDDQARVDAAASVWKGERGFSATVLVIGWLLKVYFILVLYSFALHLRRGTYSTLPKSSHNTVPSAKFTSASPSPRSTRLGGTGHTRDSSTGGARYSHLRGNSLASTALDGRASFETEGTLVETLWDGNDDLEAGGGAGGAAGGGAGAGGRSGLLRGSVSGAPPPPGFPNLANTRAAAAAEEEPRSPAFAKGTGMARSASGSSGGVTVSGGASGVAGQAPPSEKEQDEGRNPFATILGRMSGEIAR